MVPSVQISSSAFRALRKILQYRAVYCAVTCSGFLERCKKLIITDKVIKFIYAVEGRANLAGRLSFLFVYRNYTDNSPTHPQHSFTTFHVPLT